MKDILDNEDLIVAFLDSKNNQSVGFAGEREVKNRSIVTIESEKDYK